MIQRLLTWFMILLTLFCGLWWQVSDANANSTDTIQVNVYKCLYTHESSEELETKIPIREAAFVGFDLTDEYYQSRMTQQEFIDMYKTLTSDDIQKIIQEKKIPLLSDIGGESSEVYTNAEGKVSWTVAKEKNSLSAVYLFAETRTRDDLSIFETYSQPMLLFLPALDEETGKPLSVIDLFPKTINYSCTPYFFKYGIKMDGTEIRLSDAQFVLSRQRNGIKEYWAAEQPNNLLLSKWVKSSQPQDDSEVKLFISDENGLVSLGNYLLPIGEYLFEEVVAPLGYEIGPEAQKIKVVVNGDPEKRTIDTIILNNESLNKNVFGQVSPAIIQNGVPKVYNQEKKENNLEKKVYPTSQGGKGELLNTGEQFVDMSIMGMGVILIAVILWRFKNYKLNLRK